MIFGKIDVSRRIVPIVFASILLFCYDGHLVPCGAFLSRVPLTLPTRSAGTTQLLLQRRQLQQQYHQQQNNHSSNQQTQRINRRLATAAWLLDKDKSGGKLLSNVLMSSVADENDINTSDSEASNPIPLKEDEEFIAAVNEVKEAAKNVTSSSVQLTSAIVSKGPGIFWRLFTTLVSKEMRCANQMCVCFLSFSIPRVGI